MQGLQEFRNGVAGIFTDYDNDDTVTYDYASTLMDMEIDKFMTANAIDMPDEAMDEAFAAYAELHVKAFEKQHVSEAEACHMIHDRAKDMFEDSRGWKAVEAMTQTYIDRIERSAPTSQHFSPPESTTFEGPFGDIGMN